MLIYVPLNQLQDNPFQKRSEYGDIAELANDIYGHMVTRPDTLGLQQIPNGRLVGYDDGLLAPTANLDAEDWLDGDKLRPGWVVQLEFGHRRRRAFEYLMQAGRAEYYVLPIWIRDLTDEQMLDGVHSENAKRKDICAVEEAELVAEKIALTGRSQKDIAAEWGMGRSTITNLLALLKLPEPVQEANRQGVLSARQCSSLATIARIGELADDVQWGERWDPDYYSDPISPAGYIEKVVAHADTVTSDAVRQMTKDMLEYAGTTVPDAIATFDCAGAPAAVENKLVQHQCKGCAWRINQHCLNGACLETKKLYFIDETLQQAADEFSRPISSSLSHFELDGTTRAQLQAWWQTEEAKADPDIVVGRVLGVACIRPYKEGYSYVNEYSAWDADGRGAIAIGHRNPATIPGVDGGVIDVADEATVETWKEQIAQVRKANVATAKAHLRDAISTAVADFAPLIALIQPPDAETTDDTSALVETLVDFLWRKGSVPWSNTAVDEVTNLNTLLRRAGAEPLPVLGIEERAAVALADWYRLRGYASGYYNNEQKAAAAAVEALRREYSAQDPNYFKISFELDRAATDAQRVLAKKTAVEEAS